MTTQTFTANGTQTTPTPRTTFAEAKRDAKKILETEATCTITQTVTCRKGRFAVKQTVISTVKGFYKSNLTASAFVFHGGFTNFNLTQKNY